MDDKAQQQEDLQLLTVGVLLFGDDLKAIRRTLLPGCKDGDLASFVSHVFAHTAAECYIQSLSQQGLQTGAFFTGSARIRLLKSLSAAGDTIQAAFRAYDSCKLSLLSLVEALVQAAGVAAFKTAFLQAVPNPWVDAAKLTDFTPCLSWDSIQLKIQQQPSLYDSCILPALSAVQDAVESSTGSPADLSCSSPQQVLALLAQVQPTVPEACVNLLRAAESEGRMAALLAASGQPGVPHRVCADPSGRLAGLPTTRRHLLCANCGANSTSVWRAANAGLMFCNACGMFYKKHHQHRPEHLLALNKAKQAARQASTATALLQQQQSGAEPADSYGSDASPSDWCPGDAPGCSHGQRRASKRQRTHRQPQANKRLCFDRVVKWESARKRDGCNSKHDSGADHAVEDLLHNVMDRPASPSATTEMAVAALVGLKHSASSTTFTPAAQSSATAAAACAGDNSTPWGQSGQPQQQQQPQSRQPLDAQQYALAAAMLRSVLETTAHNVSGQVPASAPAPATTQQQAELRISPLNMPGGPCMADVWAQIANQAQSVAGSVAPAAAAAGSCGAGPPCQQGCIVGKSASMAPGALHPIVQEQKQLMQHMEHEELLVGTSNPYASADWSGSTGSGSRAGLAAAGSASFCRQDSANSSGTSYSLPRNNSAGSGDGRAAGGMARGISRFGTEHKQVAYHPFSPASPAAARPRCRSNSKRRDGQPACCANCGCESTCLWRRDRFNATRILCNACGIYKATNFVDRPLSGKFPARRHGKRTGTLPLFAGKPEANADRPAPAPAWRSARPAGPLAPVTSSPMAGVGLTLGSMSAPVHAANPSSSMQPGSALAAMLAAAGGGRDTFARARQPSLVDLHLPLAGAAITAIRQDSNEVQCADEAGQQHKQQQQHQQQDSLEEEQQLQQQQQPPQTQQESPVVQAAAAGQGPQHSAVVPVSTIDAGLVRQLHGVWDHAQALQRPVVCASTGYRVFPDGRYARLTEPELKGLMNPLLQPHSSSNSNSSGRSQDLPPVLLCVSSSGASMTGSVNSYAVANGAALACAAAGFSFVNKAVAGAVGAMNVEGAPLAQEPAAVQH